MTKPFKYYFEDFTVGTVDQIGSHTMTAAEIIEFATRFDPQSFHIDEAAARESIFGGLIASGWHTASTVMRLMCDSYLLDSASLGSPGIDELRWIKPVRAGDTIRGERETTAVTPSKSKPDRGVVSSIWRVYNQNDELVMSMRGMGMFARRPA